MWRLVYGDRSFSNVSSVAGTSFSKGKSTGTPQFKWISTEYVWLRVAGIPGATPTSLSLLLPLRAPGAPRRYVSPPHPPPRDFKMPLGNSADIHQQVQACDTHALEHSSAANNVASMGAGHATDATQTSHAELENQAQMATLRDSTQMALQKRQISSTRTESSLVVSGACG